MNESLSTYEAMGNLTFSRKPAALPADVRPYRKIGQILLVLHIASSKGIAPMLKLQFFNSLFTDKDALNEFLDHFSRKDVYPPHVSLDPFINRAISMAISLGYIEPLDNGNLLLLAKGKLLAEKIIKDDYLMDDEKYLLHLVKKKISAAKLNRIFKA